MATSQSVLSMSVLDFRHELFSSSSYLVHAIQQLSSDESCFTSARYNVSMSTNRLLGEDYEDVNIADVSKKN